MGPDVYASAGNKSLLLLFFRKEDSSSSTSQAVRPTGKG
jgi:hypothetical protein